MEKIQLFKTTFAFSKALSNGDLQLRQVKYNNDHWKICKSSSWYHVGLEGLSQIVFL